MDLFRKIFCRKQKKDKDKFLVSSVAFYTNDQLQIHKDKDTPKYWNGRIGEIHGDYCSVDCPELIREFPFPFQEGDEVLITIQKDDKHFRCRSTLIKINFTHKPPVIDLSIPKPAEIKEPSKIAKRLSQVDFPAKVRIDSMGEPWDSVRINEFGAYGLVFTSSEEYPSSKFLLIQLLSMEFRQELRGKIVKVEKLSQGEKTWHKYEVTFVDLGETGKLSLTNYAHKLERLSK